MKMESLSSCLQKLAMLHWLILSITILSRDHLGNNRVVVDQSGNVEEVNHYPFGGLLSSSVVMLCSLISITVEPDRKNGLDW